MEEIDKKIIQYQEALQKLQRTKEDLNRKYILAEEQYQSYRTQIMEAFGTDDPEELKKIAEHYEEEIAKLEKKLEGVI